MATQRKKTKGTKVHVAVIGCAGGNSSLTTIAVTRLREKGVKVDLISAEPTLRFVGSQEVQFQADKLLAIMPDTVTHVVLTSLALNTEIVNYLQAHADLQYYVMHGGKKALQNFPNVQVISRFQIRWVSYFNDLGQQLALL